MNKKIIFLGILLLLIFSISLVYAQDVGEGGGTAPVPANGSSRSGAVGNYTAEYDPEILDAFENQTWLPVVLRLVDNSNITVTGTKEERRTLLRQKDEWFEPVISDVLAGLSETQFSLSDKRSDGFSGWVTKKEFELLLNNPKVKSISWVKHGASITLKNESKLQNISEVEKELESETTIDVSTSKEIAELKEKLPIWHWIIVTMILLIIVFYLIMKIKKDEKR